MPTYDYLCEGCGHQFEKFQSIKAEPTRLCPECGKRKLRRLIGTGAGIIFKGSGFYCTDYRSASYNAAAKSDSAAGGASAAPATAGTSGTAGSTGGSPAGTKAATGSTTSAPATAPAAAAPAESSAKTR